jgi:hypothetical protein
MLSTAGLIANTKAPKTYVMSEDAFSRSASPAAQMSFAANIADRTA